MTIFEGGHVNTGWADYRDNHLGPELKEMQDLKFAHVQVVPHVLSDAMAYVTAEYRLETRLDGRLVEAEGLETLVLVKGADGNWRIRHSHTSSRTQACGLQREAVKRRHARIAPKDRPALRGAGW